jgi:hypothetical protein
MEKSAVAKLIYTIKVQNIHFTKQVSVAVKICACVLDISLSNLSCSVTAGNFRGHKAGDDRFLHTIPSKSLVTIPAVSLNKMQTKYFEQIIFVYILLLWVMTLNE